MNDPCRLGYHYACISNLLSLVKFTVFVFALLLSTIAFCQTPKIDLVRAQVIAEATCASCHYKEGLGSGPTVQHFYKNLHFNCMI